MIFNKIFNFLILVRIINVAIGAIAVYIAAVIINDDILLKDIYNIIGIVALSMALGNVINDYEDIETDKISHPNRPYARDTIKVPQIKFLLLILSISVIILSLTLTVKTTLFLYVCILPALFFYTRYLKTIPVLGNIIIAFLLSSIFIFTELYITNDFRILLIPSTLIFGLSLLRELLKDIQDYSGDHISKIKTLPVVIGKQNAIYYAIVYIMIFGILLAVSYFYYYININYLYSIIILIEIPLFIIVLLLLNNPSNSTFKYISYLTKCMSVVGLIIILYLGKC